MEEDELNVGGESFFPAIFAQERKRISNENGRKDEEDIRMQNEIERELKEQERIKNEEERNINFDGLKDNIDKNLDEYDKAIAGRYQEIAYNSFDSVEAMKNCSRLLPGATVQTLGYYEANDGGGGTYKIVNDDTLVDDGGSVHELENGLKAKLIYDKEILVDQFRC